MNLKAWTNDQINHNPSKLNYKFPMSITLFLLFTSYIILLAVYQTSFLKTIFPIH